MSTRVRMGWALGFLSLAACGGSAPPAPAPGSATITCPVGTRLEGATCVATEVSCPPGSVWRNGACVGAAPTSSTGDEASTARGGGASGPAAATSAAPCVDATACRKQCDAGDARSCAKAGHLLMDGKGALEADANGALALFKRACKGGDAEACYREVVLDDATPQRDFELLTQACDGGVPVACNDLGVTLARGEVGAPDLPRARALYAKACDGGFMMGCANLGRVLENGRGGAVDHGAATKRYLQACDGGYPRGCALAGKQVQNGRGADRDLGRAVTLFRRACDGNDGGGCNDLGFMYDHGEGVAEDDAFAAKLFERACGLEEAIACVNLGRMWRDGINGSANVADAVELLNKGCQLGEKGGCDELPAAVALAKRLCDKDAKLCNNYGYVVENGWGGVTRNQPEANKLYERACNAGNGDGCRNLAVEMAKGSPAEVARARPLFDKGCKLGNQKACAEALNAPKAAKK